MRKLFSQHLMMLLREIPERVLYRQHLFLGAEDVLALWGVVDALVVWFRLREYCRDACQYVFLKCDHGDA